jgi:hypothetical protein
MSGNEQQQAAEAKPKMTEKQRQSVWTTRIMIGVVAVCASVSLYYTVDALLGLGVGAAFLYAAAKGLITGA